MKPKGRDLDHLGILDLQPIESFNLTQNTFRILKDFFF